MNYLWVQTPDLRTTPQIRKIANRHFQGTFRSHLIQGSSWTIFCRPSFAQVHEYFYGLQVDLFLPDSWTQDPTSGIIMEEVKEVRLKLLIVDDSFDKTVWKYCLVP